MYNISRCWYFFSGSTNNGGTSFPEALLFRGWFIILFKWGRQHLLFKPNSVARNPRQPLVDFLYTSSISFCHSDDIVRHVRANKYFKNSAWSKYFTNTLTHEYLLFIIYSYINSWPSCSLPFCLLLFSLYLILFYGLVWGLSATYWG